MRLLFAFIMVAIISEEAFAQGAVEDIVKAKPLAIGEPEPLLPERCEFVGVRDGVKLWRGDGDTSICNDGRLCGPLTVQGHDVAAIMIAE
jgi:hypothetical protein